ncbi:MAG TPA: ATP-dependent 6-phosphofructokinase [Candidatus Dormibacteraeota bacterium]
MRVGILTGGGDAPGLNAAIRAVATLTLANGGSVVQVRDGWKGLVGDGDLVELDANAFEGILTIGGTILGSSRTNPMKMEGGVEACLRNIERAGLDALVAIGGDDTLSVARRLAAEGGPVVGCPKTMDNDLSVTEYCIGFDTAVSIVAEALDRVRTTATSHHRAVVMEVMGRDTGWVALDGGIAGGADFIIVPEFPPHLDELVEHVQARWSSGKRHSLIIAAEGTEMPELGGREDTGGERDAFGHVRLAKRGVAERLAEAIEERTGKETRSVAPSYIQRGGTPTAFDRIWATRCGTVSYDLAEKGAFGQMPVVRCGRVDTAPIADVVAEQRLIPRELYEMVQAFR